MGGGGREHALAWKLAAEPGINEVHVAPGNHGMTSEARVRTHPAVGALDAAGLVGLARSKAIELAVIGPEAPLAAGIADTLRSAGIPTFGPTQAAARIESSKAFCREIAAAAGVPMAEGATFERIAPAIEYARSMARRGGAAGVVVKADGLAGGKGVTVCELVEEAEAALRTILTEADDGSTAVVEERLVGREASLIALCDGRDAIALSPARDHKRLLDDDHGPNTGGMGAYTPVPDVPAEAVDALLDVFHRPILGEMAARGAPFQGALYAGLILTPRGPRLLECNARFGDPEAQVLLATTGVALAPLLLAAARGELAASAAHAGIGNGVVPTTGQAAVGIVVASSGYPAIPRRGDTITGLAAAAASGALVFHSATRATDEGGSATDGGRVLTVVGRGPDLATARARATTAADLIAFEGSQRRTDIAAAIPARPAPGLRVAGRSDDRASARMAAAR